MLSMWETKDVVWLIFATVRLALQGGTAKATDHTPPDALSRQSGQSRIKPYVSTMTRYNPHILLPWQTGGVEWSAFRCRYNLIPKSQAVSRGKSS